MDQREQQLQSLSICHRLFNFFTKTIASQALKTVPLGAPTTNHSHPMAHEKPREAASSGAEEVPTVDQDIGDDTMIKDNNDSYIDPEKSVEEEAPTSTTTAQPKPLKKTVSINDTVEEISMPTKSKKMSKATKKSTSFEREEDGSKPLRSILKMGSNLNEKSDSFVNRSNDG